MKNIFTIIFFLFIFLSLSGQTIAQTVLNKGIKVGINLSDWTGKGVNEFIENYEYIMNASGFDNFNLTRAHRIGFSLGGFINYEINEIFSLQPELLYTMKGVKFDGNGYFYGYNFNTDIIYKTDYIEIPLLGKLTVAKNSGITPFLLFGPFFAYNTSSKLKVKVEVEGESDSDEVDFNYIKEIDYGLILGGGFETSSGILIDIRYNLGLISVNDASDDIITKNQVILIMMGFCF